MTSDVLCEQLVRSGFHADDAVSRAVLVRTAERALTSAGCIPKWRWFVPGRIEVFGKHTDYAGGRSLLSAVPRGIAVVAAPRDDEHTRVLDAIDRAMVMVDANHPMAALKGWQRYVAVVVKRLAANFPGARLGVDIAIASDLPREAGLSSSSAFIVAVAMALIRRGELDERREWRRAITSAHQLAWYLGCVENGGDYPGLSGTAGVGTFGGSEDHTAILTCQPGHLSQNRYLPVMPLGHVALPTGWTFVVGTTGVKAHKAGNARERYNRLALAAQALRTLWNDSSAGGDAGSLAAALATSDTAAAELSALASRTLVPSFGAAELTRRLEHFIREDARVPEAVQAFADGDASRLGELAAASQRDADRLLGNQVPETRALVETAIALRALAASSFGAGFGGSVWAAVSGSDAERFAREWVKAYGDRLPAAAEAAAMIAYPAPGLIELPLE